MELCIKKLPCCSTGTLQCLGIRCWRVATEHRHVTMLQVMLCKGDTRCWHAADAAMPVVEGTIMLESSGFLAWQGHEKLVPTLQIGSSVTWRHFCNVEVEHENANTERRALRARLKRADRAPYRRQDRFGAWMHGKKRSLKQREEKNTVSWATQTMCRAAWGKKHGELRHASSTVFSWVRKLHGKMRLNWDKSEYISMRKLNTAKWDTQPHSWV